jgi:hypothetical protein
LSVRPADNGQVTSQANGDRQHTKTSAHQTLESFLEEKPGTSPSPACPSNPDPSPSKHAWPGNIKPVGSISNASPITVSTIAVDSDYDERNMKRLEDMRAEFEALDVWDKSASPSSSSLRSPGHMGGFNVFGSKTVSPPQDIDYFPPSSPIFSNPPPMQLHSGDRTPHTFRPSHTVEDDGPIVRLTQAVYTNIMEQISNAQKEKADYMREIGQLKKKLFDLTEGERDVNDTVGKLHYQLEHHKDYKAAMGRDLRQKDIELYKATMEIDKLQSKVADMEAIQKQVERLKAEVEYLRTTKDANDAALNDAVARATATKDAECARLVVEKEKEVARTTAAKNSELKLMLDAKEKLIASMEKKVRELKMAASRSQSAVSDHATRAQNLVDTQTRREKKIKLLNARLVEEMDVSTGLRNQLEILQESLPSRHQLEKAKEDLRNKTIECDRQRGEAQKMTKLLERAQQSLVRAHDENTSLKGAAHLIIPAPTTKLPKLVFPCIECFTKNVDCDSHSRCHNCVEKDEKCSRWRCAVKHVLGACNQTPCRFVHDHNGWLVLNEPRAQW